MRYGIPLVLVAAAVLTGCANAVDCALNGDNLRGRVTFGNNVSVPTDTNLVVQYSSNSFSSVSNSVTKSNPQGLLTVPYGFCVVPGTYQLRAFEDLNGNGSLDTGEPWGLLNVGKTVTASGSDSGTSGRVTDADIVIDNP